MKFVDSARSPLILLVLCLAVAAVTGCGSSGAPAPVQAPAVAPAPAVSIFDIGKAFEADEAKAKAEYASKTIRLTDIIAGMYVEDEKYLQCHPYNASAKEGSVGSDAFFRKESIKQIVFPFGVCIRIEDPKLVEGIETSKTTTVDGKARTDFADLVEVECEFDGLIDGELFFKPVKITKK